MCLPEIIITILTTIVSRIFPSHGMETVQGKREIMLNYARNAIEIGQIMASVVSNEYKGFSAVCIYILVAKIAPH